MNTSVNLCNNSGMMEVTRCSFCEKFLSIPPIYNHEFDTICGRCKFVNKSEECKWTRQTIYETIARFLIFPCSNVSYGCRAQLNWGKVEEHENTCVYKKINCPFSNDIFQYERCLWNGFGPGLNEHLENCHGDLIEKNSEINFTDNTLNRILLTRIHKQLMIVTIKYEEPGRISCLVMVNGASTNCENYRYQLELYDDNHKTSLILRRNRIEDLTEFHENLINDDKCLIMDLQVISDLLNNPSTVKGKFGVIKKLKHEVHFADRSVNEKFMRELECPVCKNYMLPPIQMCSTGHSFCSECEDEMLECPTCKSPFEDARNYTLETLTSCISYPCMYRDSGCSVTCPGDKIRDHEQQCSYAGVMCFLDCSASPIINMHMYKHLNEEHSECLIVPGALNVLDMQGGEEFTKKYAIFYGNDIFKLIVSFEEDLMFSLQQFEANENHYTYEIKIIHSDDVTVQKLSVERDCFSTNCDNYCGIEISKGMLETFISEEDVLSFEVHLQKLC